MARGSSTSEESTQQWKRGRCERTKSCPQVLMSGALLMILGILQTVHEFLLHSTLLAAVQHQRACEPPATVVPIC